MVFVSHRMDFNIEEDWHSSRTYIQIRIMVLVSHYGDFDICRDNYSSRTCVWIRRMVPISLRVGDSFETLCWVRWVYHMTYSTSCLTTQMQYGLERWCKKWCMLIPGCYQTILIVMMMLMTWSTWSWDILNNTSI